MTLTYAQTIKALSDAALATERATQASGIGVQPWRPTPDPEAEAKRDACDAEIAFRVTYAEGYDVEITTSPPITYENQPLQGGIEYDK